MHQSSQAFKGLVFENHFSNTDFFVHERRTSIYSAMDTLFVTASHLPARAEVSFKIPRITSFTMNDLKECRINISTISLHAISSLHASSRYLRADPRLVTCN